MSSNIKGFDKHGFAIFAPEYNPEAERCHICFRDEEEDVIGWQKVLMEWDMARTKLHIMIRKYLKQGIPYHLRGAVWKQLLDVDVLRLSATFNYKAQLVAVREQLVDMGISEFGGADTVTHLCELESQGFLTHVSGHISSDCLQQILMDLERCFPTQRRFFMGHNEGIEGRASLFRILAVYARYNPEVGYCQGMSYVGGMFLMQMNETDAFWSLVSLLERTKYLRGYYDTHMERIQRHAQVFYKLMKKRFPDVTSHLDAVGVDMMMFVVPWFLSLYTSLHCWETVLAIWDIFLLEGMCGLFKAGLAIITVLKDDILKTDDLSHLLPKLLHPEPERVHCEVLIPLVWETTLEEIEIIQLEVEVHDEEEAVKNKVSKKPCGVKRSHDETQIFTSSSKRRRTEAKSQLLNGQPSLFRKFVSIFTRDQQNEETPRMTKQRLMTRASHDSNEPRTPRTPRVVNSVEYSGSRQRTAVVASVQTRLSTRRQCVEERGNRWSIHVSPPTTPTYHSKEIQKVSTRSPAKIPRRTATPRRRLGAPSSRCSPRLQYQRALRDVKNTPSKDVQYTKDFQSPTKQQFSQETMPIFGHTGLTPKLELHYLDKITGNALHNKGIKKKLVEQLHVDKKVNERFSPLTEMTQTALV